MRASHDEPTRSPDAADVRPRVGISACAHGARVRYNGGDAKAFAVRDELAPRVDLVPVCPEMAMGLGVPREAMRLVRPGRGEPAQIVTSRTRRDMTALATDTAAAIVAALPTDLDGFVLMGRSPMCGLERVKVYNAAMVPNPEGVGFFAAALVQARPELVLIEAGRLEEPRQRHWYLQRLFVHARLRALPRRAKALQEFHAQHKFLLLAQGATHMRRLGRIVADTHGEGVQEGFSRYATALAAALRVEPTRAMMADALLHMYGFCKETLPAPQKVALRDAIDAYRGGRGALDVPLSLLRFANALVGSAYLAAQALFAPYPPLSSSVATMGRSSDGA